MWVAYFPSEDRKADLLAVFSDTSDVPIDWDNDDLVSVEEETDLNLGEVYPNLFTHLSRYFLAAEARIAEQTGRPVPDPPDSSHATDFLRAYWVVPGPRLAGIRRHCIPVHVSPLDHVFVLNASHLAVGWEHVNFEHVNGAVTRMIRETALAADGRAWPPIGLRWDLLAHFARHKATLQDATHISMLPPTNLVNVTARSVYVPTKAVTPVDFLGRQHIGPDGTIFEDHTQSQCVSIGAKASLRTPVFYAGRALCRRGTNAQGTKVTLFGGGPKTVFRIFDAFDDEHVAYMTNSDRDASTPPLRITRDIDFIEGRAVQYYY